MVHRIGVSPKVNRAIRTEFEIVRPDSLGTFSAVVMLRDEYDSYRLCASRFRPIVAARIDDLPSIIADVRKAFSD